MVWYSTSFGREYVKLYPHRNDEEATSQVNHILNVLGSSTPRKGLRNILDVGCGGGRHSAAFAKHGFSCVGIDLSADLLAFTRFHESVSYVRADMRRIPFLPESFDLLCSMFTSFGYFDTDSEHLALLKGWREQTSHYLVLDYLNRSHVIETLVPREEVALEGRTAFIERHISDDGRRVEKTVKVKAADKEESFVESVRMYDLQEMRQLLINSRFRIQHIFGNWEGGEWHPVSERLIIFAEVM